MSDDAVAALAWRFVESEDGDLKLTLEPPHPLFDEAFEDVVNPWVRVGDEEILSTYRVDALIDGLERPSGEPGVEQVLAEGSVGQLIKVDDLVLARDTIFDVEDETLAVSDVLPALHAWRLELLRRGASGDVPDQVVGGEVEE